MASKSGVQTPSGPHCKDTGAHLAKPLTVWCDAAEVEAAIVLPLAARFMKEAGVVKRRGDTQLPITAMPLVAAHRRLGEQPDRAWKLSMMDALLVPCKTIIGGITFDSDSVFFDPAAHPVYFQPQDCTDTSEIICLDVIAASRSRDRAMRDAALDAASSRADVRKAADQMEWATSCKICMENPAAYKWKACLHATEGPAIICLKCRNCVLADATVGRANINKHKIRTPCVICRQWSVLVRFVK